jgi:hypothetical protein
MEISIPFKVDSLHAVEFSKVPSLYKSNFICCDYKRSILQDVDCSYLSIVSSELSSDIAVTSIKSPNNSRVFVRSTYQYHEVVRVNEGVGANCLKDSGLHACP